nr:uncharacterized protein LOC113822953 [Penaeus vannamei]
MAQYPDRDWSKKDTILNLLLRRQLRRTILRTKTSAESSGVHGRFKFNREYKTLNQGEKKPKKKRIPRLKRKVQQSLIKRRQSLKQKKTHRELKLALKRPHPKERPKIKQLQTPRKRCQVRKRTKYPQSQ